MKSEVARLRQQIELELDAMHRGMTGVALGTTRHAFIQARMQRIGACQETLAQQIGQKESMQLVYQLYTQKMEQDGSYKTRL